ncbi:MAG TPA: hypothetical protein VGV59_13685 [Pyrinomonadaceae bacterium]|nr:hypothetical protein [Pyrinomonadaceae bacterium]
MKNLTLWLALLAALAFTTTTQTTGINPVQHSEGAPKTTTTSKGINPVQHSE